MDKRAIRVKRDHPDQPKKFFTFDLNMKEKIVLPEEKITPSEALNEEITWDPGTSD